MANVCLTAMTLTLKCNKTIAVRRVRLRAGSAWTTHLACPVPQVTLTFPLIGVPFNATPLLTPMLTSFVNYAYFPASLAFLLPPAQPANFPTSFKI
jgi:hypothetical protein